MSRPEPPASPEAIARRVLTDASNEGEALVSAARIVFCALILARFLALGGIHAEGGVPAALLQLPVLLVGILASGLALGAARRRQFGPRLLVASAVLDAVFAHASLLSTLLWHGPHYTGLLRMPDPAAAIAVIFITALRLSPRAAWVGTATNLLLMVGLAVLDLRLNARHVTYGASEVALLLIFMGSAGAVATLACGVARRLVLQAGCESARGERTRRHLGQLLREHHDVRTLLSAARLRTDLILREPGSPACARHAQALTTDLRELEEFVASVKSRALGELAMAGAAESVDVVSTLRHVADVVQTRFSHVRIVVGAESPGGREGLLARVVGGERGLAHVVTNLLVNACEGDGRRGASTVRASVEPGVDLGQVLLRVSDDGPGFRAELLDGARPRAVTTKPGGSGLGMMLVGGLVEASGGTLHASSLPGGGARVEVLLPAGG
ncbi:sensor histidine kinase [Pyxidicoccus xibeiensis]|uniref:sensor histidine kinase n=1 Tax=Pyxidicoccus xibeiensis TaxID=2906759 RepID=UPI0020A800F7|nr:sensor histidine kinase [Pyxidicoccus xibeiensis]MCP3135961.1 ATP-binding protein [Pyxidicoccus xibeiensis]